MSTMTTENPAESTVLSTHRPGADPHNLVPGEELWESTIAGAVWVKITNKRDELENASIGSGQRLRLTTRDRVMNQDRIRDPKHDPFVNGMLKRVDADQNEDPRTRTPNALSIEELLAVFALAPNPFERKVRELDEVPIRKLREIADDADATVSQIKLLDEIIQERYVNARTMPSYDELRSLNQVATD